MIYAPSGKCTAFCFSFGVQAKNWEKNLHVYSAKTHCILICDLAVHSSAVHAQSVAVIGAGAIGCIFAEAASALGHSTTLCVRRVPRKIDIQRNGEIYPLNAHVADKPDHLSPVDWVVIATKVQDTLSVAPWLSRLVGKKTVLLLLQNGIDGVNLARTMVGDNPILPSVVYINAERRHADLIVHHFGSHLEVPSCPEAERLKQLMAGSVDIHPQDDFTTAAWRKLIINIAVNPITALTAQRFGVFAVPEIRTLAAGLIREAAAVGNASGANLPDAEVEKIIAMCENLKPQGGTSMLFDRLKGNRLEVEHLTGTIVRLARSHGIAVPLNTAILALLTAVDQPKHTGPHAAEEPLQVAVAS